MQIFLTLLIGICFIFLGGADFFSVFNKSGFRNAASESIRFFGRPIAEGPHRGKNKRLLWLIGGFVMIAQVIYELAIAS